VRRLDLDHSRDIGGLLGTTFSVFGALAPVSSFPPAPDRPVFLPPQA
jgi:hypothetical protein